MRFGLRARIVALLLILSVVPAVAVVWFVRDRVLSLVRAGDARRVDDALAEFDAAIARERGDVTAALASAPWPDDRPASRRTDRAAVDAGEAGARAMDEAGLDCLTVLDPSGRVLWSGHAPRTMGTLDAGRLTLPVDSAAFIEEEITPGIGRVLTLQGRRVLPGGLQIAGGRFIDAAFLRRLAPAGTVRAVLLDPAGRILAASDPADPLPLPPAADLERARGAYDAHGVPHLFRSQPVRDQKGRLVGTLLAAVSQERLAALGASLSVAAALAIVSAVAGSLAIGWVLARGVIGPLRRLEDMAARVAEERYEPLGPPMPPGEIGALARAFDRMAARIADNRERLRQTERLAAAEDVARRVAHEIKNPLSPIALTLEGLVRTRRLRPREFDAAFEEAVRVIQEEIQRMRGILEDFARFGRLPLPRPRPADLNEVVRGALRLHAGDESAQVRADLDAALPRVMIDPDRISEVIHNLLVNALQAAARAARPDGAASITVSTRADDAGAVLVVADDGPGLDDEVLRRLFEPYVSARPGGTGLGLAIARRIVLDHGGRIEAGNRPEGGAAIRIMLPWAAGETRDPRAAAAGGGTSWPPS